MRIFVILVAFVVLALLSLTLIILLIARTTAIARSFLFYIELTSLLDDIVA